MDGSCFDTRDDPGPGRETEISAGAPGDQGDEGETAVNGDPDKRAGRDHLSDPADNPVPHAGLFGDRI